MPSAIVCALTAGYTVVSLECNSARTVSIAPGKRAIKGISHEAIVTPTDIASTDSVVQLRHHDSPKI